MEEGRDGDIGSESLESKSKGEDWRNELKDFLLKSQFSYSDSILVIMKYFNDYNILQKLGIHKILRRKDLKKLQRTLLEKKLE